MKINSRMSLWTKPITQILLFPSHQIKQVLAMNTAHCSVLTPHRREYWELAQIGLEQDHIPANTSLLTPASMQHTSVAATNCSTAPATLDMPVCHWSIIMPCTRDRVLCAKELLVWRQTYNKERIHTSPLMYSGEQGTMNTSTAQNCGLSYNRIHDLEPYVWNRGSGRKHIEVYREHYWCTETLLQPIGPQQNFQAYHALLIQPHRSKK